MTFFIILISTITVTATITFLITRHKYTQKVEYMMDALEDGELNFRFTDNSKFNKAMNRIRYIYERQRQQNEQDSWTKLIRVLTHEIMNTVAPISSLSSALSKSFDKNGTTDMDVKAGLDIISESSENLIKFVQTYRELSGVARPLRKAIILKDLIDNVILLEQEQLSAKNVECRYSTDNIDIKVYADDGQLTQIFINLIKNAIQANASQIKIESGTNTDGDIFVRVSNNGEPIPRSNREQIFIPFFTTKADGSGIGLSISRQILRQHNASISLLKSDENETAFELIFK